MKKQDLHLFGITNEEDETNPKEWNWVYCQTNKIPYILVSIMDDKAFSHIKIDLDTMSDGLFFEDSVDISKIWHKFYRDYCDKTQMSDNKWAHIGTLSSFGIIIWSKDVLAFTPAFQKHIMETVNLYGKIDLLLEEYTLLHRRRNNMMLGNTPFIKEKYDKLGAQEDELRYKIWDKKFKKKPITEAGRTIAFKQWKITLTQ